MTTATNNGTDAEIRDRFAEIPDPADAEQAALDKAYHNLIVEIAKAGDVAEHVKALRAAKTYVSPGKPLAVAFRQLSTLSRRLWNELPKATVAVLKPMGRTKEEVVADIRYALFEIVCNKTATAAIRRKAKMNLDKYEAELKEFLDGCEERSDKRFFAQRDGKNVAVECAVEKGHWNRLTIQANEARDHHMMIEIIAKKELPQWVTTR